MRRKGAKLMTVGKIASKKCKGGKIFKNVELMKRHKVWSQAVRPLIS